MQTSLANSAIILQIKNANFLGYCFHMNTKIQRDFQIGISVPLTRCLYSPYKNQSKEFTLPKTPVFSLFYCEKLRFFSKAAITMNSTGDNTEMGKVILIILLFLYFAHRNSYFANGKLYMYTAQYTRRCLHQQETVVFFHLIPHVYFRLSKSYLELLNLLKNTLF